MADPVADRVTVGSSASPYCLDSDEEEYDGEEEEEEGWSGDGHCWV